MKSLNERVKINNIVPDEKCVNRKQRRIDLKVKMKSLIRPEKLCVRKKNLSLKKTLRQGYLIKKRLGFLDLSKAAEKVTQDPIQNDAKLYEKK